MNNQLSKAPSESIRTVLANGIVEWLLGGNYHRVDGPAIEAPNGTREWYMDNMRHRADGPAVEWADGSKQWYLNGNRHRADGPAVEGADGLKEWYLNGKRHRVDGPAIEKIDGTREWYLYGEKVEESEHPHWVKQELIKVVENGSPSSDIDASGRSITTEKPKVSSI